MSDSPIQLQPTKQVKTSCWNSLPWILCGLAADDEELARTAGRQAIAKFNCSDPSPIAIFGRSHRQSQRFLDVNFQGDDPNDVALRPYLDEWLG